MKRIFIVGCPRSGTTLLQSMLAANDNIYSMPETHFFRLGLSKRSGILKSFLFRQKMAKMIYPSKTRFYLSEKMYIIDCINFLDKKALKSGKNYWIEKTPEHLFSVADIRNYYPDCLVINISRDPLPTIASIVNMWNLYREQKGILFSIKNRIATFLKALISSLSLKNSFFYGDYIKATSLWLLCDKEVKEKKYFNIYYENLITNPSNELKNICRFLGIDYNSNMLTPEKKSANLIKSDEPWKQDNLRKIDGVKSNKFDILDRKTKDFIINFLAKKGK